MSRTDALEVLRPYLTGSDHDGVDLAFPLPAHEERRTAVLGAALALAVPLTLALLGYPGARLVESAGWWLVNERVLTLRWLGYGASISVAGFLAWLWIRPPGVRLRLDRRRLLVRRSLRRDVEIRLADVKTCLVDTDGAVVTLGRLPGDPPRSGHDVWRCRAPQDRRLPVLPVPSAVSRSLADLVRSHLPTEGEGNPGAIPPELRRASHRAREDQGA